MRILITGGAGFIGSHLSDRLLEADHQIIVMDNLISGSMENIAHNLNNPAFTFIKHDVSNYIAIDGPLDAVLHLASPASPNPASPYGYPQLPIQTLKASSLGTHNALGLTKAKNARFLLASTSEVYGDPLEHPQREEYWGHVDPIGPRSVYDEAKRFAEALTMAYHRFHGLDTRLVRIFNTYGPRMRLDDGRVIPNFLCQSIAGESLTIYGDGSQTRSFCYVDDLVSGLIRLLESDYHEPVNLGNPSELTIAGLAQTINQMTGNPAEMLRLPDQRDTSDPQRRRPDITRAQTILGWEPQIDLQTGLTRTLADFRKRL